MGREACIMIVELQNDEHTPNIFSFRPSFFELDDTFFSMALLIFVSNACNLQSRGRIAGGTILYVVLLSHSPGKGIRLA